MVNCTRTREVRRKDSEAETVCLSFFCSSRSVSVCSLCSSRSFMWLPGTENLSISCQRFQLCSAPLSALKNLLFHTHELHYLWPWVKWAVSGHAVCVCLCFCVNVSVPCGRWEAIWHTSAQTDVAQHITASQERDLKAQEHLDLWQPSPQPTSYLYLGAKDRAGEEGEGKTDSLHVISP